MTKQLTHGSLFAGIGGFELAASEAGIKTLWNCEIEPYPRLVLKARFPGVRQYGDIRKLNGGEVEPVDIITFGSPCQSFSQAGARQGLDGASGLFYEAVRIIREMRETTNNLFPRYAVMENVPGIYSSKSQGKSDFREVLNELLKIKDETVDVPLPEGGKFLTAGAVVGDGYSLAWRTLCASKFGQTVHWTVCLNAAAECSLSSVLQTNAPQRYYLSRKAKDGILRRVTARGKVLPEVLRLALEA